MFSNIVGRSKLLQGNDLKDYIKELKKRKIYKLLNNETKKDKLRRLVVKYQLKLYLKRISRR